MDLLTAIDTRVSAVRLAEPAPCSADVERILRSGVRAPDHGRLVPTRFVVFQGGALKRLGGAIADCHSRKNPDATNEQLKSERNKAFRAPVVIVIAARVDPEHKVPAIEQMHSVAAAVQNMFLTAHSLGYGAMWKTGDAAYDPHVNTSLGLEWDDQIIAFLYLGTTVGAPPIKPSSLDGVVTWA